MKISDRERQLILVKKNGNTAAAEGRKSEIREVAEEHNMNTETLRQRHLREPDVPLRELAKRPVASREQSARKGSKTWRKINTSRGSK